MSEGEVSGQNGGAFGEAAAQANTQSNQTSELHAAMRHENTINQGGVKDHVDSTKYGGGKYDTVEALDNGYLELQRTFTQKMQSVADRAQPAHAGCAVDLNLKVSNFLFLRTYC